MDEGEAFRDLHAPWREERLLAEDAALVVVDKPAGLSTQAQEAGDDAITRVRAFLAARAGASPSGVYLGSHQHLDRDTSGVLVFARDRAFNAALAPQFEGRTVRVTYVAAVLGFAGREGARGELAGAASSARGASAHKRRGGGHAGPQGRTAYRVIARNGPRTLLELSPDSGRGAQARAAVRDAGARIAGDTAHDGPPDARVYLHASAIELAHPATRARVRYESPLPSEFQRWLAGDAGDPYADSALLREALVRAADARAAIGRDPQTNAYRLVNEAGDGLPGITVDRYGGYALVQFYDPALREHEARVLDEVQRLGARGVYVKYRPKQSNTLVDTRREDLAPAHAVRGEDAPEEFAVRESGVLYGVRLGDGLSTGIFLDQRGNRARVREMARGKRVLNLFAYTCPFTVAAAAGGAASTVSVDVSAGALAWAQRNLERNALWDAERHALITADVFAWLDGARARGDRYDLVLLDPPSYSTTRDGSRFSSDSGYRALAAQALAVVADGGTLLACSNHRGIPHARFRRYLHEAAREASRELARVRDVPPPPDFPVAPGREVHLKTALVTLNG